MVALDPADDPDARDEAFVRRGADFVGRFLAPYHRFRLDGLEHLPDGPALIVGNHSGHLTPVDSFLVPWAIMRERGVAHAPYGLGHADLFTLPVVGPMWPRMGVLRASHDNAARVFARGGKVMVYPGGNVDATRPSWRRNHVDFDGRSGFVRLAVRERVPIVPLASAGAHDTFIVLAQLKIAARWLPRRIVWPLTLSFPWGLSFGLPYVPWPARVRSRFLPAVAPEALASLPEAEAAERVRAELEAAVQQLAREP